MTGLELFTAAYIECMLWSSSDDNDVPLDRNYTDSDISGEAMKRIVKDCEIFYNAYSYQISVGCQTLLQCEDEEYAGHDFWLTRNGHGCGFWDGDWAEPYATQLTDASHSFGECEPCIGDDGLIYLM